MGQRVVTGTILLCATLPFAHDDSGDAINDAQSTGRSARDYELQWAGLQIDRSHVYRSGTACRN